MRQSRAIDIREGIPAAVAMAMSAVFGPSSAVNHFTVTSRRRYLATAISWQTAVMNVVSQRGGVVIAESLALIKSFCFQVVGRRASLAVRCNLGVAISR